MQCSEYKELISAYIDDELSKKEVKKLLAHFGQCSHCKETLSTFILQKESVVTLRSSYLGPVPDPDFFQKVMAEIDRESSLPKPGNAHFSDFFQWISFPMKKPAFAIVSSVLILTGIVAGTFWDKFSLNKGQKNLLSVYELQDKKVPKRNVKIVDLERDENSLVFHHIAHSSAATFATKPCLLEYAAYTPVSETH